MKKQTFTFNSIGAAFMLTIMMMLFGGRANAQSWDIVGTAGFSAAEARYNSMAINASGTPYVAYSDEGNSSKATVMMYNGSSWVTVGSAGFSAGTALYTSIAISASGTPYVAYQDQGNGDRVTVMMYNGSSWVTVGSAGFSAPGGTSNFISIAISASGTPYVAYQDGSTSDLATVKMYNGSSWVTVGSAGFSAGEADYTSMAINASGTPYVAYGDGGNSGKATVMMYNGSSWITVGSAGFSVGGVNYPSMVLSASGTPYVAYSDLGNSSKATVMMYNGSSWVTVGSAGFSAGNARLPSLAISAGGTPYVAYEDVPNSFKATVMMYNGSSWVDEGSAGFSAGGVAFISMALNASGTPYVVYEDSAHSDKATVMDFPCNAPDVPVVSASSGTICADSVTTLNITAGSLNSAPAWQWYSGSCGGTSVGSGTSVNVTPSVTTTYYVRGEGGCITTPGSCGTITVTVNPNPTAGAITNGAQSICAGSETATPYADATAANGTGNWSSDNTAIASVDDAGNVYGGTTSGSANIIYTVTSGTGCGSVTTSSPVTVNPNYTITASAGSNGSISPAGVTNVCSGGSQAYSITPAAGCTISNVLVDGVSVGAVTTYTFSPVSAAHTISATFAPACTTTFNSGIVVQTYTVPATVTSIAVDLRGGRGGGSVLYWGLGGRVTATLAVTPGQVLYIMVGGIGGTFGGGNGGGINGGGGATDIRTGGTALTNRIIVAGGGGGSSGANAGGAGGGLTGGDGGGIYGGGGGTQSAGGLGIYGLAGSNGSLGQGGYGSGGVGGGGSGYYGGGGGLPVGSLGGGGGGGGSSYTDPVLASNVVHTQGYNTGNGSVIISLPAVSVATVSPVCQGGATAALGGSFGIPATGAVWSDGLTGATAGTFSNNDGSTPGTATYTASTSAPATVTLTLTSTGGSCGAAAGSVTLTVNPNPTVSVNPVSAICQSGTTAALGGAFGGGATAATWDDGSAGGTFSPDNLTGLTPGATTYTASAGSSSPVTLTLTTSGGSCGTTSTTTSLIVNPNPTAGTITTTAQSACTGYATYYTDTTAAYGTGSWSSSNYSIANIDPYGGGVVYAVAGSAGGVANITYTVTSGVGCGSAFTTLPVTINPSSAVSVSSIAAICQGGTTAALAGSFGGGATAATWSDGDAGGTFSSDNATGLTPNLTTYTASAGWSSPVTLTLTTSGGLCGNTSAATLLTVNPNPSAGTITNGAQSVCTGAETATPYTDATAANGTGAWSSDNTAIASVDGSGNIYGGATSGSANIIYTVTSGTGCGSVTTSSPVTVNSNYAITASAGSNGSISPSGVTNVCSGSSQAYTITPATGYAVSGVVVDGVNTGAGTSYTFSSVSATHTISATFTPACTTAFSYTGGVQTYTVPASVTSIAVDLGGGRAGVSPAHGYVLGGRVTAVLAVTPGEVLNIYVGGEGANGAPGAPAPGGYNGGGSSPVRSSGGGASDIRTGGTALSNRIIVAGGGGGSGVRDGGTLNYGGAGGGLTGASGGGYYAHTGGTGGTQSGGGLAGNFYGTMDYATNGVLGDGGNGAPADYPDDESGGGGGGGGYYGGGGGGTAFLSGEINPGGGGGGGSSYTDPVLATAVVHTQGYNNGNGYVTISSLLVVSAAPVSPVCQGGTTAALGGSSNAPAAGAVWSDGSAGGTFANNDGSAPGAATYTASTSAPATVTLTLTSTNGLCGAASASVTLTVNPNPTVSVNPVSAICQGGTTAALGGSFGSSATSATWSDGSAGGTFSSDNLTGLTPNLTTYTASAGSSSPVTLTLTTSGGLCGNTSASTVVTVNPLPTISGATTIYTTGSVTLGADITGGTWSSDNTAAVSIDPSSGIYIGEGAGTADITYTTPATCSSSVVVTDTTAMPAGALNFDGVTNRIDGTNANLPQGGADRSIEAWVYITNNSGNHTIFSWGDYDCTDHTRSALITTPNGATNNLYYTSECNDFNATSAVVPMNTWTHVAMTLTGTTVSFYINGSLVQTGNVPNPVTTSGTEWSIGNTSGDPDTREPFAGTMDEVRVWNRVLCQGEIANSMNCQFTGSQSGLVAYYRFNQGLIGANNAAVNTLTDASASASAGTLSNFALNGPASNWVAGYVTGSCSAWTAPTATITAGGTAVFCAGGSVTLSANSVVGYSYQWSNGSGNIAGATNQTYNATETTTDAYAVTVTEDGNCTARSAATTVTVNPNPTVSAGNVSVCAGSTVTLPGSPSGGTWSGTGVTTPYSNATPGIYSYTYTYTNSSHCTGAATSTISVNALPSVHISSSNNLTCTATSATLTASGAATYTWSGSSATSSTRTVTAAGTYSVTGTGSDGCHATATYTETLTTTPLATPTVTVTNYCGSSTLTAAGIVAGAAVTWSPSGSGNPLTVTSSGSYRATQSLSGCTSAASAAVTATPGSGLTLTPAIVNVSCHGGSNGSITVSATGGSGTYTYSWSPCVGSSASITGKAAGTYTVTVTNGTCHATGVYTITQPSAALAVSGTVTNETCNGGDNGKITTAVTGGTPAYTYLWSPGSATTSSLSGKAAGTYNVTVTDAHGCAVSGAYAVTQPAALTCAITVTPGSSVYTGGVPTNIYLGYGPTTATLTATATGGSGYSYSWSSTSGTGSLSSTRIANPVFTASLAGSYTYVCTITSESGCTTTCSVSICVTDAVDHSHTGNILVCHGYGCTPTTVSCASGSVPSYITSSYCPSNHLGPIGSGCSKTGSRESGDDDEKPVVINELTVNAYPNPFNGEVNVKVQSNLTDDVDVTVYDVTGRVMQTKPAQPVESVIILGQSLVPGIYFIEVNQGGAVKKVKVVKY